MGCVFCATGQVTMRAFFESFFFFFDLFKYVRFEFDRFDW